MERSAIISDIQKFQSFIWKGETIHIELPNGSVTELIENYSYSTDRFHGMQWFLDSINRGYWSVSEIPDEILPETIIGDTEDLTEIE